VLTGEEAEYVCKYAGINASGSTLQGSALPISR